MIPVASAPSTTKALSMHGACPSPEPAARCRGPAASMGGPVSVDSLFVLCLLLFLDNATFAAFTTPLLLAYAPHFEPWQVGVFGAASAGAGSTVQLVLFRWLLSTDWPWVKRFAPSREKLEQTLKSSPSTSFLAILIARATPIPDGPIKLIVAAGR